MRIRILTALAVVSVVGGLAFAQGSHRFNPMVELLSQKKPVFGLYAPSNRRFLGGGPGAPGGAGMRPGGAATPAAPAAPAEPAKTPAQLAKEAVDYPISDFIFDGSMEGDFDRAYPAFSELMSGMSSAGILLKSPYPHLNHSIVVKTHEIAPDPVKAAANIGKQLNLGVTGIMFVGVESADEVKSGLAAMRFKSKGGTRPEEVGGAPAFWGMSEKEYKEKADLWPLNPNGELVNWTIVESKAGLAKVREIAAVKGIGVLWPGAGTLRGVFSTTDASGQRKLDEAAWEAAIQQVLSACKEFNVPCGFPATPNDIEMRMKQGFSVFVMNWGDPGFKAVEVGRKAAGR
jgi:4-hydroxy-2-oxoheptanedioate aldolase